MRVLYAHALLLLVLLFSACTTTVEPMKSFEEVIKETSCKTCNDFITQEEARNYIKNLRPDCFDSLSIGGDSIFCPNLPLIGKVINYLDCKKCKDFTNEADAKAYADTNKACRFFLDPNNNGVFCEDGEGNFGSGSGTGGGGGGTTCKTCSDFTDQVFAEIYAIVNPNCKSKLDPDNDGVYCESLPSVNTTDCKTCSDFKNQREASAYASINADCGKRLDRDGDGKYCESLPE